MNDVDRIAMNQVLGTLGSINQHLANIDASMVQHFSEDAKAFEEGRAWRKKHDERVEKRELVNAEGKGFRRGQLWILGVLVTASPFVSAIAMKLMFG